MTLPTLSGTLPKSDTTFIFTTQIPLSYLGREGVGHATFQKLLRKLYRNH
jgi:hypothetical protein